MHNRRTPHHLAQQHPLRAQPRPLSRTCSSPGVRLLPWHRTHNRPRPSRRRSSTCRRPRLTSRQDKAPHRRSEPHRCRTTLRCSTTRSRRNRSALRMPRRSHRESAMSPRPVPRRMPPLAHQIPSRHLRGEMCRQAPHRWPRIRKHPAHLRGHAPSVVARLPACQQEHRPRQPPRRLPRRCLRPLPRAR